MNTEKIEQILDDLKHRTAWGVSLDVMELVIAKSNALHLIEQIDIALEKIEEFSRRYIPDPLDTPVGEAIE